MNSKRDALALILVFRSVERVAWELRVPREGMQFSMFILDTA
jgi:hypothetical protein